MEDNTTNLIVNYLPQTYTDEEFTQLFAGVGTLKASKIVRDRSTGYSYGFGFVDYENPLDANRAIATLNGFKLQNKTLKVAFSRSGEKIKGANLYVQNIPKATSVSELEEMFTPYGNIIQARILSDSSGQSKGVGFILYNSNEEAKSAIDALNGFMPEGGTVALTVKHAEDNKGKARAPPGGGGGGMGFGGGGGPMRGPYPGMGGGGGYGRGGMGRGGMGGYGGGPMRSQGVGARFRFNPMTGSYPTPYGGGPQHQNGGNNGAEEEDGSEGFTLFVYNIGVAADERALWTLFSPFGQIQKVNVIYDYQKNQCKGYGFVTMRNYHEATNSIQALNGYMYTEKPMQVSFKSDKD